MLKFNRKTPLTKQELTDLRRRAKKFGKAAADAPTAKELLHAIVHALTPQDFQRMDAKVLDLIEFHAFSEQGKDRDESEEFSAYLVELILQQGER